MTASIMTATGGTRAQCLAAVGSIVDGAAVFDGRAFAKGGGVQEMIVFTDFSTGGGDIDDAFALGAIVHAATTGGFGLERLVVVLSARKKAPNDTTTPATACKWLRLLFVAKGASVTQTTDEELSFTCKRNGGGDMRVDVCWDLGRTFVISEGAASKASIEVRFHLVTTPTKDRVAAAVIIGPVSADTAALLNGHLDAKRIRLIVGVTVSGGVNGGESVTNSADFLVGDVARACGGGKTLTGIVELNTAETRPLLMTRKFLANHGLLTKDLLKLAHKSAWRAFAGFYHSNGSSAENGLMSFRLIASNGQSSAPIPVQQVVATMTRVYLAALDGGEYGAARFHALMPDALKSHYNQPYLPYLRIAKLYVAMCTANLAFERAIPDDTDTGWAAVYAAIAGARDDDEHGPAVDPLLDLLSQECNSNEKTRNLVGAAIQHISSVTCAEISVGNVRAMYVASVFVTYMRLLTAGTHLRKLGLALSSIGRSNLVSDGRTQVSTARPPFIVITPTLDASDVG
jgi:hypothetical protein